MQDRWSQIVAAVESGDSDRVNDAIEGIGNLALAERIELYEACFDDLRHRYEAAADGYVRQSFVRVAEQLTPGLPTVVALETPDRALGADEAEIRAQTDELCAFLLEALTDDDGRVRHAAIRALKDVYRTYDALGDDPTLHDLERELDKLADQASGTKQEHLQKAAENARFTRKSAFARLIEDLQTDPPSSED